MTDSQDKSGDAVSVNGLPDQCPGCSLDLTATGMYLKYRVDYDGDQRRSRFWCPECDEMLSEETLSEGEYPMSGPAGTQDESGAEPLGPHGTTVKNVYGDIYRLERNGQMFKLTEGEIAALCSVVRGDSDAE